MADRPFRIVFMGTPDFAVPSLKALIDHGEEIAAVITQPDRPKGRGRKLTAPPVKQVAEAAGLPVLQPTRIRGEDFVEELRELAPDLIVVVAYGRILPGPVLNLPPRGTINVHGSLLPKYRGAAPIQWALINGERETGVTIMQMDEGMDTGDILLPAALAIDDEDTAATLAARLARLGGDTLVEALDRLRAGTLEATPQDDGKATMAPPLCKHDGVIDWSKSAFAISCQIRGLDPWPTAFTTLEGKALRLFRPLAVEAEAGEAFGTICRADGEGLLIATGHGYLLVREVQLEGAKRMPVDAFLRGRPLAKGTRFA